ncbi:TPA: hypothetical protein DIC20_03550 [Candidatus Dependentiae bacterium]|nr:MAG: hypothetical protein US03_C0001G0097 [candidate division TM6 bacterium GW2011_GWF2_36_131]KKQ03767.1 MAG: hypothetical protein US13_C0001G0107 [candidate division TM6 bacterium GW2011_GWE2_36_25]KKQ19912.1 MAG: hypothetical protein US32_C0003G0029 [candidate division TM6 bacterium GW2011_GWA2_36_9]HBR70533.1 hypothetical protein [Candidatus Dependentiae bacterium]HCU00751.1 hypothetical protein [Candidatus Dependentiae bacterium]
MNKFISPITNFFFNLDKKNFNHILIGSISGIIILFGLFLYLQFHEVRRLKREMIKVNNERMQTKEILEQNEILKKQQKEVEELIAQDKQFKYIKQEFLKIIDTLNLKNNLKTDPTPVTKELEHLRSQGYEEVQLDIELTKLNMRQLTELLIELEKNKRINIKRLEIAKSKNEPTVEVQPLVISTIQKKAEATEEAETEQG